MGQRVVSTVLTLNAGRNYELFWSEASFQRGSKCKMSNQDLFNHAFEYVFQAIVEYVNRGGNLNVTNDDGMSLFCVFLEGYTNEGDTSPEQQYPAILVRSRRTRADHLTEMDGDNYVCFHYSRNHNPECDCCSRRHEEHELL